MPDQISIDDAQGNLKDLIAGLAPGAELVITDHEQPIAKLVAEPAKSASEQAKRRGGQLKGQIVIAPDFDQLPDDIAEAFGANEG
jgi:antitoxin (DNA-binding transcriptional repressor) of toxin-antitoxin stability system